MLPTRTEVATDRGQNAPMHDDTLTRLEAMLVSLRDQVDHLTERVDARLADQQQQLMRVRRELGRLQFRSPASPTTQPPT